MPWRLFPNFTIVAWSRLTGNWSIGRESYQSTTNDGCYQGSQCHNNGSKLSSKNFRYETDQTVSQFTKHIWSLSLVTRSHTSKKSGTPLPKNNWNVINVSYQAAKAKTRRAAKKQENLYLNEISLHHANILYIGYRVECLKR